MNSLKINIIPTILTHKRTFGYFLLIGTLTALIYFLTFSLSLKYLHFHYNIALSIAYFSAFLFHFFSNRNITFRNRERNFSAEFIKYVIMVTINYFVTLIIVDVTIQQYGLSPHWAILCPVGITAVIGYLLSNFWVFKTAEEGI